MYKINWQCLYVFGSTRCMESANNTRANVCTQYRAVGNVHTTQQTNTTLQSSQPYEIIHNPERSADVTRKASMATPNTALSGPTTMTTDKQVKESEPNMPSQLSRKPFNTMFPQLSKNHSLGFQQGSIVPVTTAIVSPANSLYFPMQVAAIRPSPVAAVAPQIKVKEKPVPKSAFIPQTEEMDSSMYYDPPFTRSQKKG